MPYPKLKNENYQNLGGINQKASPFMTGNNEALALLNWDFTRPGAYTQRPGTTQYISVGTLPVSSFFEFSRLSGQSYKIFSEGATLLGFNGSTYAIRAMGVTAGLTFLPTSHSILDFAPFVDRLFVAGADNDFFKTDGVTAFSFGVPPNTSSIGFVTSGSGSGWTGWFQYAVAWVNDRGALGPVIPVTDAAHIYEGVTLTPGVFSIAVAGFTSVRLSMPTPAAGYTAQYGLQQAIIFRAGPFDSSAGVNGPTAVITDQSSKSFGSLFSIGSMPIGACNVFFDFGTTSGPAIVIGNTPANFSWFTLIPKYLNVYNNALCLTGFSSMPSTMWVSALGEPESIGATMGFEFRNNDGDRITGMINYAGIQVIFKQHSTHIFTGFSSDDYNQRELTDQYGCLSNRACCVWQDKLWFLDVNGIAEYNGARVATVSNRVEQTFRRMNVQAAIDQAVMIHVKDRNEIWTSFPIDGATYNNYLVVYDYVADAFTEWFGPQTASLGIATGPSLLLQPFYGDYSGSIHYFDPIFYSDSGRAFTCSITSRYFGDLGFSVTKQFRRLYFDMVMAQAAGVTHLLKVNLFSDMNSNAVQFSTTFAISSSLPQQNRIDFGVPGKTLAFQMHHVAQDSALQFSGFTVEYRFQRAV